MTYGFSRDDVGAFMQAYLAQKIIPLIRSGFTGPDQRRPADSDGRRTWSPALVPVLRSVSAVGFGGGYFGIMFCHRVGMDYVSCSPYRVPIARLAAAQAAAEERSAVKKVAGKSIKKKRK